MTASDWEEWIPDRRAPDATRPLAVLGKGANLRVTAQVVEMLENPTHIVFFLDRIGHRVAFQASDASVRHAFPLKLYNHSKMPAVAVGGFLKWAAIPNDDRREFLVEHCGDRRVCFRFEAADHDGEFEEFTLKGVAVQQQGPNASISRNGHITFNQPAVALLGDPERVVLLYNHARTLIGLRAASDELHARRLRKSLGQRTWALAAEGFLKQYAIPHDQGRSYEPFLDGAAMVIDLNRPKPLSRRSKHAGAPHVARE